jgi:DNA polymerase-1
MHIIYKVATTIAEVNAYLGDAKVVAYDYEAAPDEIYRSDPSATLDPNRCHICSMSLSVAEGTGIMIPVAHRNGPNMDPEEFAQFLREFLTNKTIIKVAHNIAYESALAYRLGIVTQPPVYDTICASQMCLKNSFQYRKLSDSGLKTLAAELCGEALPTYTEVTGGRHYDELDPNDPETIRYSCADADFVHIVKSW